MPTLPEEEWLMELSTGSTYGGKQTVTETNILASPSVKESSAEQDSPVEDQEDSSVPLDQASLLESPQTSPTTRSRGRSLQRAQSLVGVSKGRPADDFYVTPVRATEALLSVEDFEGMIWEPACGTGAISEVLISHFHDVISSDLLDKGYGTPNADFLKSDGIFVENVITNPPFRHAQEFVEQALSCTSGKVAMLLKLAFLEGGKRSAFLKTTPLKNVWVFSKRLKMSRNGDENAYPGGGMISFAWFVWEHGYQGRPMIGWI